jgi:hypothetical protein
MIFVPVKGKSTNTAEVSSDAEKITMHLHCACRQLPNILTIALAEISGDFAEVFL